jgi:hypothetical protein
MDVILDANQYLADVKMKNVNFQSLLDYLRKTGSKLVVFKLVRDEVLARHRDLIQAGSVKAIAGIRNLERLSFQAKLPRVPDIDVALEQKHLERQLLRPAPGVTSSLEDGYGDISLAEVARRGIVRQLPASKNGEELRDVMLWLMASAYAKKTSNKVGFITADTGFRDADQPGLHPELQDELIREGVVLHFAKSIDDFVKAHAPAPKPVTPEWADTHLKKRDLIQIKGMFKVASERLAVAKYNLGSILSTTEPIIQFRKGELYEISNESTYAELQYEGSLAVDINDSIFWIGNRTVGTTSATITAGQVYSAPQFGIGGFHPYEAGKTTHLLSLLGHAPPVFKPPTEFVSPAPADATKTFLFLASFIVSMRIVNKKIALLELDPDKVQVISAEELPKRK